MDTGIARPFDAVVHLLRPVFVVTIGQERSAVEQPGAVLMRVAIGRVTDVVTGLFQPADEVVLITEEMAASIVRRVRPVKRDLHSTRRARDSVSTTAVVLIEALAGAVVWIIVVCLVSCHALLIEKIGVTRVVAHRKSNIGLITLRVDEL